MSWLFNPDGRPPPAQEPIEEEEMEEDYSGRKVSTRKANQPYLAYTRYRREQERLHAEWVERRKEREEKMARGEEDVGPEEPDPTAVEEVGLLGLLKFIVYCLLLTALVGKFFTGSFFFNHDVQVPDLRKLWPSNERLFTEAGLSKFDGSDPVKPIYLAIDGKVYDVTAGRHTYGPGGSYHFMAGKDAARAFGTGCFAAHQTHDLRGLDEKEMKGVDHWKNFFETSKKYSYVGKVLHHPIDPMSPIPEPCKEKKKPQKPVDSKPQSKANHNEL